MLKLKTSLCLLLQVALAISTVAQTPEPTKRTTSNISETLERIVKAYTNLGRFSGSVLVAKDG